MKQLNLFKTSKVFILEYLSVFSGITISAALLYSLPCRNNFWLFDDLYIIRFFTDNSTISYLADPSIWKMFSSAHFTPLVLLSYHMDYYLFGLDPSRFYAHSLISLIILCLCLYSLLRYYLSIIPSIMAVAFLLTSKPFSAASEILMFRHYIEGGIFACLALIFFILALRQKSYTCLTLSTSSYFLAMLAKEVYIPLALIMLFLPENRFYQRLQYITLFIFVLMIYFIWRFYMLGSFVGGSASGFDLFSIYNNMINILLFFQQTILPNLLALILVLIIFRSLTIIITKELNIPHEINFLLLISALTLSIAAPLYPISQYLSADFISEFRLSFAAAIGVACISGITIEQAKLLYIQLIKHYKHNKYKKIATKSLTLCIILIFMLGFAEVIHKNNQWLWHHRVADITPRNIKGEFLWNHQDKAYVVRNSQNISIQYYQNLAHFLKIKEGRTMAGVIADHYGLLSPNINQHWQHADIWSYDKDTNLMEVVTDNVYNRRNHMLASIKGQELSFQFDIRKGNFSLKLHTDNEKGNFFVIWGYLPGLYCDSFTFPKGSRTQIEGTLFAGLAGYFRFGWESDTGDIHLSPELWIDFSKVEKITWP